MDKKWGIVIVIVILIVAVVAGYFIYKGINSSSGHGSISSPEQLQNEIKLNSAITGQIIKNSGGKTNG